MWCRRKLSKGKRGEKNTYKDRGYLIAVRATRGRNPFKGAQMIARYFFDVLNIEYSGGLFFQG
jgi:hypothetical protein